MPRPLCCRRISQEPVCAIFKPAGVPLRLLDEIVLTLDELEALRLADLEGQYQEHAAVTMNVSRQTFGRIVESARRKTAQALILGKALRIEGGKIEMRKMRQFKCAHCQHSWALPFGGGRPLDCPNCSSTNFCRTQPAGAETVAAGNGAQSQKRCCHRHGRTK